MDMKMMMADSPMMAGMDMTAMQNLVEASAACEQACVMCSGSAMEMDDCAAMCMNMADMANTMMRMMLRSAGMHMDSMMQMMQACMTMADACAAECMMHADDNDMCRMCAMACQEMAKACEAMMMAMPAS